MGFTPHSIPLTSGIRGDVTSLSTDSPQLLNAASNVVISHKGALIGRPGAVSEDGIIQTTSTSAGGPALQPGTLLSTYINSAVSAGLETVNGHIVSLYQGLAAIRSSKLYNGVKSWRSGGSFWSMSKVSTPTLDYIINDLGNGTGSGLVNPVAVGAGLISVPITSGPAVSLGVTDLNNINLFDTQSLANFDATSKYNACIATNGVGDVILYPKADGSLRYHLVSPTGTPGSGTEVVLSGAGTVNATTVNGQGQACWLIAGPASNEFFYAFRSATAGRIVVGRFIGGGVGTATLNLNGLGNVNWGVALCHNGVATGSGGKLCIGWGDNTANVYKTKIVTCTSTIVLTDAALDVSHHAINSTVYSPHTVGTGFNGTICICYSDDTTNLRIDIRDFTTTTTSNQVQLFQGSKQWYAFTPASIFGANSNTVIGLQLLTKGPNPGAHTFVGSTQWYILDITNNIVSTTCGSPIIMAAGPINYQLMTPPVNAIVTSTTYKFGVVNGITFDVNGPQTAGSTAITLRLIPSRGVAINGIALFTGCTPYWFDDNQFSPVNFTEGAPVLSAVNFVAGGSAINPGSYSFQAIWETTNNNGQIVRSAPSNIVTKATSVAAQKIDITVSIPQVIGKYLSINNNIRVKIYSTQANPAAGAALYLMGSTTLPLTNGSVTAASVTVTLFQTSDTDTTQEQLYTGGNVFSDGPPEAGDRGCAYSLGRLWIADSRRIYASKILRRNIAPAWNTAGTLVMEVPTSIGEIRGLGNISNKLAVIGDLGTAIVFGPGFDDLGNGPGWSIEVTSHVQFSKNIGAGPRSICTIPDIGVVFIGSDNEFWLMDNSGKPVVISRPTKDTNSGTTNFIELAYCNSHTGGTGSIEHGPMLISDGVFLKLLDIETGQWLAWNTVDSGNHTGEGSVFCSLNGVLFSQSLPSKIVFSFSSYLTGQDFGVNFAQQIATGNASVSGVSGAPPLIWGRLRGIGVSTNAFVGAYTLIAQVIADSGSAIILDKTVTATAGVNFKWPWNNTEEFRTTKQRCGNFSITLSASPGAVEWGSIDYWSWTSEDRQPSRNRH